MPACPTCGKHLDDSVRFCPDDGTPVTQTAASTVPITPSQRESPTSDLVLPVVVGGRYRLEEFRGGGGMAKVYRALDTTLERPVAVKLINPELRQDPEFDNRFQREARIASQLSDPHIVVVHDFGLDAVHGPYLVMEYLDGLSLREHLQKHGPMPVRAALDLMTQLLLALIHAHQKGIIHRDIKPDNIFLLNQSGVRLHVRVLDFGIARIYRSDEPAHAETLTRPGAILGTPRYMSPEQLAGQPLLAQSDLYSAALVIYEALTGTLPYVSHKSLAELCPMTPKALLEVIEECLQQNPADRPGSATAVYLRLKDPCKASGVLMIPSEELEKMLSCGDSSQAATVLHTPTSNLRWWPRVRLALILLLTTGLLAYAGYGITSWLLHYRQAAQSEHESVLGLEVGQTRDHVVATLGRPPDQKWNGDPWNGSAREVLGHVLRPEDFVGDHMGKLEVLAWEGNRICVLLEDNDVRGIVVREPRAMTNRRLRIGQGVDDMYRRYAPHEPKAEVKELLGGKPGSPGHVELYRYESVGIGFEAQAGIIQAITLFRPMRR